MITPVNGHVLIEPIKHEGFMATQHETYEEIGIVVDVDENLTMRASLHSSMAAQRAAAPSVGDKVYFDAWLAAKYHKEGGEPDEFYWLVKWEDVRGIEHVES